MYPHLLKQWDKPVNSLDKPMVKGHPESYALMNKGQTTSGTEFKVSNQTLKYWSSCTISIDVLRTCIDTCNVYIYVLIINCQINSMITALLEFYHDENGNKNVAFWGKWNENILWRNKFHIN